MKTLTLLAIAILAGAALAGCAGDRDATPTPTSPTSATPATSTPATTSPAVTSPVTTTPATTTPATTTPTATTPTMTTPVTSTPVVTTPVTPTPPTTPTGTAGDIYVVSLNDSVASGGNATVCWRVEGTGVASHTAIHFDTESHPNATGFGEYDAGAIYPDNGPAPTPTPFSGEFALPATFCGELQGLTETTYLRAHARVGTTDVLSVEKSVPVAPMANISFVNFLEIFPAGFTNNVCWRVDGLTGESTHTAVHFDDESHPNSTSFGDYDLGASYPGNFTASNISVTVPGAFCGDIVMPDNGTLYMRAHIIHNDTHYLSEERNVRAAPRVTVSGGLPLTAAAGSTVNVCWRAEGSGETAHTAIHWDTTSHPDATDFGAYVGGAVYPDNAESTGGPWMLPGPFCADLTMPESGALYFRPHVIYPSPGGQELGPEYAITVA